MIPFDLLIVALTNAAGRGNLVLEPRAWKVYLMRLVTQWVDKQVYLYEQANPMNSGSLARQKVAQAFLRETLKVLYSETSHLTTQSQMIDDLWVFIQEHEEHAKVMFRGTMRLQAEDQGGRYVHFLRRIAETVLWSTESQRDITSERAWFMAYSDNYITTKALRSAAIDEMEMEHAMRMKEDAA